MAGNIGNDPMLEIFIFETLELITQVENIILNSEEENSFEFQINKVFRIVHTIKGNAGMMDLNGIATVSHSLEDVLSLIRENHPEGIDYSALADVVLKSMDFIKNEVNQIQLGCASYRDWSVIVKEINGFLSSLKSTDLQDLKNGNPALKNEGNKEELNTDCEMQYKALLFFEDDCQMENLRAFNVVRDLENVAEIISYTPRDIMENDESADIIRENGFEILFSSNLSLDNINALISEIILLKNFKLDRVSPIKKEQSSVETNKTEKSNTQTSIKQSMISVNISKLDRLMNLVGELVISQSMVIQNPELEGLVSNGFKKASRQLQKVTDEVQDAVMSIRMVSLSVTFQKMHRIVRDMSKKLEKDIKLEIIGEETEVDKNIIEHLSDPIMHMIRNSVDHGIESAEERRKKGKPSAGKITLEARNEGGAVWIIVKDDGRGLNKEYILQKARQRGLLIKPEEELTDKEIYSCIFLPGFSTNEEITEYSGRGVGMDVVNKNIADVGGTVAVDSIPENGTTISVKIPLTLAIIDGMKLRVGKSIYIIPITSIKESFRFKESTIIKDETNNSEIIMIRGECYPILRIHEVFNVKPDTTDLKEGIIVMVENESRVLCLFADELIGSQQVVVKALPKYLNKVQGVSGCTVMGNGSVGLIIDVSGLVNSV